MIKTLSLAALIFLFSSHLALAQNKQAYLSNMPTVPVATGSLELQNSAILFDKPDGRIAEVLIYSTSLDIDSILSFYKTSLPQLGWIQKSENTYIRDREELTLTPIIEENQKEDISRVKVSLSPLEKK